MLTRLFSLTLATVAVNLGATTPAAAQPDAIADRAPIQLSQARSSSQQLNDLLEQGRELADAGDYNRALAVYQQAAQLESDNARIFSGIGYLQARQRNYAAAAVAYQRAIALENDNSDFYFALGYSLAKAGDAAGAAQAYQNAVRLAPDNRENHMGLAVAQMRLGQFDAAIQTYETIIARDPEGSGDLYGTIATVLLNQGQTQRAVQLLERVMPRYPNEVALRLPLAVALLAQGNYDRGLQVLQEVAQLDPDNPQVHLQMARIYQERGEIDAADDAFRSAAIAAPNDPNVALAQGNYWLGRGMHIMATSKFREVTELAPDNPAGFYGLATVLAERNRRDEAIAALEQARRLYQGRGDTAGTQRVDALLNELR